MTYEEALKLTNVQQGDNYRIVPLKELSTWMREIDIVYGNIEVGNKEVAKDRLESLSHNILSVIL